MRGGPWSSKRGDQPGQGLCLYRAGQDRGHGGGLMAWGGAEHIHWGPHSWAQVCSLCLHHQTGQQVDREDQELGMVVGETLSSTVCLHRS